MRNFFLYIFLSVICFFTACEKMDDTYMNFKNELNAFDGNAYDYFLSQPKGTYDSLVKALDQCPQLKLAVMQDSLTIFALSNRSFELSFANLNNARASMVPKLPPVNIATINDSILQVYLARYFIVDKYTTKRIAYSSDGLRVPSALNGYFMHMQYVSTDASGYVAGGPKSLLLSDTNNSLNAANWIRVGTTTVDIGTRNAIIDYLPANHIFGFGTDFILKVNSIR